jgi:tRNA dimethylallyltransferase
MASRHNPKLVVILGETASGKSAVAIEIAEKYNGEIICADSRTIYKGMDISTAKPSKADQARVRHHLLDVLYPNESFSAAAFKELANQAIEDVSKRGKLPILVGGSGLYIDSVVFDFKFGLPADSNLRSRLDAMSTEELQEVIRKEGLVMPDNTQNRRHLIRAIEKNGKDGFTKSSLRADTLLIGLSLDREELKERVALRADSMLSNGLLDEIKRVSNEYGWAGEALQTPAFKAFHLYLLGDMSLDQAKENFIKNDLSLAKRQRTWFKRNKSIHWVSIDKKQIEIDDLLTSFLNK